MKKLYLSILALILVGSFLMAIESEPSEIVGYVAYECVTTDDGNLNFIALPLGNADGTRTYGWASELGDAYPGLIEAVFKWEETVQSWASSFLLGGTWIDDFELIGGNSYMINITGPFAFYSYGLLGPIAQYSLITTPTGNLNFIMVPLNRSNLTMAGELGDDIGPVEAVFKWAGMLQSWESAFKVGTVWNDDYPIQIAMPLMVNVTDNIVWPSSRFQTRN